jgi:hypothetical protein
MLEMSAVGQEGTLSLHCRDWRITGLGRWERALRFGLSSRLPRALAASMGRERESAAPPRAASLVAVPGRCGSGAGARPDRAPGGAWTAQGPAHLAVGRCSLRLRY